MKRYKNLSYFRVLACLGIVCTHLRQRVGLDGGRLYEITHYMQHGIYMFFIISGFLAVYTYEAKEYSPRQYWAKRLIRILPVYYVIVIYNVIEHQFILNDMPSDEYGLGWLRYIFMINQCVPGDDMWRNLSFTWTVSIFVAFYLIVPVICRFVDSYRKSLIAFVLSYVGILAVERVYGYIGIGRDWFTPIFYIIYFMLGAVVYYAVKDHRENNAAVLALALVLFNFSLSRFNSPMTLSLLFAAMLLVSMQLEIKNTYIQKAFDVVDRYSYEIYLGHAVVLETLDALRESVAMPGYAVIAAGVLGTALISAILYHCIDVPAAELWTKLCKADKQR